MALRELSKDTVRLIKSTQVITTPVSVVKELVENSIDAGATTVTIRLENHGFTLVEVRDNGSGIEEKDMEFIAKPHFTSKILSFADLASLNTYGFRGEALASLCAVAEVSITTKTKDSMMGLTYTFDHSGSVVSKKPAAAPNGTTIMAKSLFKNLPVRKHYYNSSKRRREELKKVEDMMFAFTLAAPGVHLTLSHDRCPIIQKSSVKNIQEALMSTFPTIYKDLVLRKKSTEDIHVEVYLPGSGPCDNPSLSRTTPDRFFVLVNQRPVTHKSVEKLVKAFYSQKLQGSHGRYPLGVVILTVPLACVDINLEPNKTRVLLRNENKILETIQEILSELYGPLDHPKKPNAVDTSDVNHKTEITCTFGGLKEDSESLEEESINSIQNAEVIDDFLDMKNKKNISVSNGKIRAAFTNQATVGDVGRGKAVSDITKNIENCGIIPEKNTFTKPFQVRKMEKNQENSSITSEKAATSNAQLNVSDKSSQKELCHGKNKVLCTSTPNDLTDACFPSIPESSIIPDDDFDDFLSENDSSVAKSFEDRVSGIAPLSLSCTNVLYESDGKENNQPTEQNHHDAFPRSDFSETKLHESFTGSDGIPVYKIPPLHPLDEAESKHKNNNSEKLIQERKDSFSRESLEHISPFNSDLENIQDGKSRGPEEREGSNGGSWSRGMPVDGKDIQTVQVLNTAAVRLKPPSESSSVQDAAKRSKRHVPLEACGLSATPPKKTKIKALSPADHNYIYGKPVKKPSSPFILFSRDIRQQVLSEYPGADFAVVAKQMADRWKALDPDSKNHYRELSSAEADKYHKEVKLIKESRGLTFGSPLARGCKTAASLDKYIAPLTPYIKSKGKVIQQQPHVADRPWLQHKKEIRCSLNIIKDKLRKRRPIKNYSDALTILGRVTDSGGWVCVQGSDIIALNVYRVYEVVLSHNLLKTFKLSVKPLDDPIPFNASTIGMENWAALLKLQRELVPDRNFYCVTDQRLTANGLCVALFPGATTSVAISHGEVTQMTDAVKFYGIPDLKEILCVLAASPLASLQQTRPFKLQHWIKAEAVRMVRSEPNILRQDDVLEKVKRLHLMLNGVEGVDQLPTEHKCTHGKPLFTKLYSLEKLLCPKLPCPKVKFTKILNEEV